MKSLFKKYLLKFLFKFLKGDVRLFVIQVNTPFCETAKGRELVLSQITREIKERPIIKINLERHKGQDVDTYKAKFLIINW